ncbi:MAG: T9SS type A sorting domain-containing protein [Bacteroidia bacterium]
MDVLWGFFVFSIKAVCLLFYNDRISGRIPDFFTINKKSQMFRTIMYSISLACLMLSFSFAQNTLNVDFQTSQLGANVSFSSGQTLQVPVNVTGGISVTLCNMEVTFHMVNGGGATVYSYTAPVQSIVNGFGGGVGNITVPFVGPGTPVPASGNYCIKVEAEYTSAWNANNRVATQLNGNEIDKDFFSSGTTITHEIASAFCVDFCGLDVSIRIGTRRGDHVFVAADVSGGSGNYLYTWTRGDSTVNNSHDFIWVPCGCYTLTLTVTDNITGCSITKSIEFCPCPPVFGFSREGVAEESDRISIYPNPADDVVWIGNVEGLNEPAVQVVDLSGKVTLRKWLVNEVDNRLDLSQIQPGIYIIKIQSGVNLIRQEKLIVR